MYGKPINYQGIKGRAYFGESGQWSWVITVDGEVIDHGYGYETEALADDALAHAILLKTLES
jgi:hypothetical protein